MARTKQEKEGFVVNPNTGRSVKIGSATYKKLVKNGDIKAKDTTSPKPKKGKGKGKGKKVKKSPARSPTKNSPGKQKSPPKKKVKMSPVKFKSPPKKTNDLEKEVLRKVLIDLIWRDYFIQKIEELVPEMVEYYNNNNDDYIDLEAPVYGEGELEEENLERLLISEMLQIFRDYTD